MKKQQLYKSTKKAMAWMLSAGMVVSVFQGITLYPMQVSAAESETMIQYYLNGTVVSEDPSYSGEYDGYVEEEKKDKELTLTPVAAAGYDFSILNLTSQEADSTGELFTPLSRDYVKDASQSDGNRLIADGENASYTITLDEEGTYENGSSYTVMPEIAAYFDADSNILNETLLENRVDGNDETVEGWLSGSISAGTEKWNGSDTNTNNQQAVFDAGEGREYHLTGAVIYGRMMWPDRFDGLTIETSDDGKVYTAVDGQTEKNTSDNKYYTSRYAADYDKTARYLRITSAWPTKDFSYVGIYGTVETAEKSTDESTSETVDEQAEISYQYYKDGSCIATGTDLETPPEESAGYEGYVKTETLGTTRTVTVTAASGYDFMMLNLTDSQGNVTTALSKDYAKSGSTSNRITDGMYTFTYTVDSEQDTATTSSDIGTVYREEPTVNVYFDEQGELVNDEILALDPIYSKFTYADAPLTLWLQDTATLNAGKESWDGKDIPNGDYGTWYAGDGKAFCLSKIIAYSRRDWSDSRFTATIEGSNDGENFKTIFTTEKASGSEQYSIKRQVSELEVKYRVLRISATANNTDVNIMKLYGTVETVADDELSSVAGEKQEVVAPDETDNLVEIQEVTSKAGFVHPGIGFTKESLENLRDQVRAKKDPWYSYYKEMANTDVASTTFKCDNSTDGVTATTVAYNGASMRYRSENDGNRAYIQALMYVITGDETYRSNALRIIRIWEQLDPEQYSYFTDSHIHTAYGLYHMVQAAEILRYTSYETESLQWTDEDTQRFTDNVITPSINTFMNFNDKFMNQHNFPLLGTISGAIFTDDIESYKEKVEWTTVNADAPVPEYTGSISQLFRYMTVDNLTGEALAVDQQHVQHVEMGRDLAHADGDVSNLIILSNIINSQNTLVDQTAGTVSEASDAVNIYEFLGNRILAGVDYFCQFDMGYDVNWTSVITEPADGDYPAKYYTIPSDQYQGRLYAVGDLAELYYVYRFELGYTEEQLEELAPYYVKAVAQRPGYTCYEAGSGENVNLAAVTNDDWWTFIPADAAAEEESSTLASYVPESTSSSEQYVYEMENYVSIIDGSNEVKNQTDTIGISQEEDTKYIHTMASNGNTMFAVYNLSLINRKNTEYVSIRVRTNGNAVLELKKEADSTPFATLQLPDTKGTWKNIIFDMSYSEVTSGQYSDLTYLMYFNVLGDGTTVDFDNVNVNAEKTLSAPEFNNVSDSENNVIIAAGDAYTFDFSANDSNPLHQSSLAYELQGDTLNGAEFDETTGLFTWNPGAEQAGNYSEYVVVSDGTTVVSLHLNLIVTADRTNAVEALDTLYDTGETYTEVTTIDYTNAVAELNASMNAETTAFYEKVTNCINAVSKLELLNPLLSDGSLDYPDLVAATSLDTGKLPSLVDSNPVTFTGDLFMKYFTIDFGAFYKVKASAFQLQPRNIWANRMAGCVVMGSNDGENWTILTEQAAYSDLLQTLEVKAEYKDTAYRFFKVSSLAADTDSKYAADVNILSVGELRIFGTRQEEGSKIRSVSISTNAEIIRNHEGDGRYPQIFAERAGAGDEIYLDITAVTAIQDLEVTIAGKTADVVQSETDALQYRATVTLDEEAAKNNASKNATMCISYNYQADGSEDVTKGADVTFTTDESSVFVVSNENEITPMSMEQVSVYCSRNSDGTIRMSDTDLRAQLTNLWDNNSTTNSEVWTTSGSGSGSYFIFDFGENQGVDLERVEMLSRLNFLDRSTSTYVQGSNDYVPNTTEGTWDTLTNSTESTAKWQGLKVTQHKYYRYIRVINDGTWYGNISELRFYGQVTEDLEHAVDTTDLEAVIAAAENVDLTSYSDESVAAFQTALTEAREILNRESAVQSEVDLAQANLEKAQSELTVGETEDQDKEDDSDKTDDSDQTDDSDKEDDSDQTDDSETPSKQVTTVSKITLNKKTATVALGKSITIKATIKPSNAKNKKLTWKSSNKKVATVSAKGKVTTVGIGSTVIKCTAADGSKKTASCKITVQGTKTTVLNATAAGTKTGVKIKWNKVDNASGYLIYGSKNGTSMKTMKKITKGSTTSWTTGKLKTNTTYQFQVKAYKVVNSKKIVILKSQTVYASKKGGTSTYAKSVAVNFSKATLKVGKTKTIKATLKKADKKKRWDKNASKVRYATTNSKIATVSAKGKIKAVGKGSCTIYVYAGNGVNKKIKITVK